MDAETNIKPTQELSANRLRVGVVCIFLWWIPVWAAAPVIAATLGSESKVPQITLVLMIIQTIIGGIGLLVAGKQIVNLFKKIPHKQVPKAVWRMLISGKTV